MKKVSAPSFIHARGDNVSNDMWHDTCNETVRKYHTVIPQHNALQPASPTFLKNYDEIDWGHSEKPWDDSVMPNPPKNPRNVSGKTSR